MSTLALTHSESDSATVSALAVLGFLAPVVRDVLLAPYAGPRLTDEVIAARLRECELCGVDDPAEPLVAMLHTGNRGHVAAHQDCGEARGYELEVPPEPGVQLVLGNLSPAGGSARFSTVGAGAGSTGAVGHPAGTRSAVDAVAVPSQRGPGRGAATAADDATGPAAVAGLRLSRTVRQTGARVSLYDGMAAGMDTSDGRWQAVCEDHGSVCSFDTFAAARWHLPSPADWCGGCRTVVETPPATAAPVSPISAVAPVLMLTCPSCGSSNVADLGGYAECRECGAGFAL